MKTVMVRGIVMVNFEFEVDKDEFVALCKENNLDPNNVGKFSDSEWLSIRGGLGDIVSNDDSNIEYGDIYDHNTLSVDEVTVQTKDIITCVYEQGDAVHSVEIS